MIIALLSINNCGNIFFKDPDMNMIYAFIIILDNKHFWSLEFILERLIYFYSCISLN